MNKILSSILLSSAVFLAASPLSTERKPLPRPILNKIEHEPTTGTNLRRDPKTGEWVEYKFEAKIIYDEKTGNFLLRWTGMDGQRKTIVYEPATRLDAVVEAGVDYDSQENAYRYSYVLSNLRTSKRKLQTLYLETQAPIRNVSAPDATWYSRPLTDSLQEQFEVGRGWAWSQTRERRVGLLPGQEIAGFLFLSSGLPSVVKCYVRHYTVLKGVGEEPPEELFAAIHRVMWKIPQGVTIGPASPPQRAQPAAFTRKILGMLDVSVEQGWIESPSVAQEMRGLLEDAAKALAEGDTRKASGILESLLIRVEEESQRALLSEAYALLRFNVEFLLTHIGGK